MRECHERQAALCHEFAKAQFFPSGLDAKCQAVRVITPVRLSESHPVPGNLWFPEELLQADTLRLGLPVPQNPSRYEQLHEPKHVRVLGGQAPVDKAS